MWWKIKVKSYNLYWPTFTEMTEVDIILEEIRKEITQEDSFKILSVVILLYEKGSEMEIC